ncbi:unnamed protein product [Diatraea saccharalis]|uniref:Uncharacterized protein n=1 Tax=Diatraea saccharalis TaxID=40085 RepID=A0A9N9WH05_9NEOP|nr:unnamed protein product [Diatraea saccharalis]
MSVNKEDTLRQFCDVTGADEERSKFFLESSNWQLEIALSSFYEHGGNVDEVPTNPTARASPPTLSDSDMESPPASPARPQKKDKKKNTSKFATLDSLQNDSSSQDDEVLKYIKLQTEFIVQEFFCDKASCSKKDKKNVKFNSDTDKDQEIINLKNEIIRLTIENVELKNEIARLKSNKESGQAFYAGGSERSGQQILGPGKGRKDFVTEMFKSVRERGAVAFDDDPSPSASRGRAIFSGVGYRLGQTSDDHEQITPTNTQSSQQQEQLRSVRLRLYREGFTVDNGPLRLYTDPENAEFLNCIRRGEMPSELSSEGGGVRVSLEDRWHEEYSRQPQRPTPTTVGATAPVAADPNDRAANQRAAQESVQLDHSRPLTTVQFRLADGSRITGQFNHSHTVADLHQYVSRAEPLYQLQPFVLLTTFPSTELTDPAATLAQANLLNTTLLQRLK